MYDNTHWICSSTNTLLIFMCIYSLHTVINPATFPELPSNSCDLATSTCMLGYANVAAPSAPSNPAWVIIACSTASCSCCCCTTCSRLMLCRLMVYIKIEEGGLDLFYFSFRFIFLFSIFRTTRVRVD